MSRCSITLKYPVIFSIVYFSPLITAEPMFLIKDYYDKNFLSFACCDIRFKLKIYD